jgi:hypothetical protein
MAVSCFFFLFFSFLFFFFSFGIEGFINRLNTGFHNEDRKRGRGGRPD